MLGVALASGARALGVHDDRRREAAVVPQLDRLHRAEHVVGVQEGDRDLDDVRDLHLERRPEEAAAAGGPRAPGRAQGLDVRPRCAVRQLRARVPRRGPDPEARPAEDQAPGQPRRGVPPRRLRPGQRVHGALGNRHDRDRVQPRRVRRATGLRGLPRRQGARTRRRSSTKPGTRTRSRCSRSGRTRTPPGRRTSTPRPISCST